MFCRNCGAQLPEGAAFCQTCGSPAAQMQPETMSQETVNPGMVYQNGQQVNPGMAYQNGQSVNQGVPYPNGQQQYTQMGGYPYPSAGLQNTNHSKNKKVGIIVGVVVLAILVVAVILIIKLFGGGGYKGAVKKYMNGVINHDLDAIIEAFPKEMREDKRDDYLGWYYEDEEEFWNEFDATLAYEYGDHVKLSYRIGETEAYEKTELADLIEDLAYSYDMEYLISEAYEVEVIMEIKGSEDKGEESTYLTVAKIKGNWYVVGE